MGQLALGIAGGVIGAFFGVPQLGFLAGSLIGGLVFKSNSGNTQGPRLDNLSVTASTYGSSIPIVYGTMRTGGNIIWSKSLREQPTTQGAGGKGGGPTVTNYTYFWTGMVGLCEGPITDVLRIWADSKIVYDKTGTSVVATKLNFRLYTGTEDQLPDATYEADKGAENVPAHRGMAYVVFDDIPVADYGNRVPSWTFEIVSNADATEAQGVHPVTDLPNYDDIGADRTVLRANYDQQRFYTRASDGIHVFDAVTYQEIAMATTEQIYPNNPTDTWVTGVNTGFCLDSDGFIYMPIGGQQFVTLTKIDPNSLTEVARNFTQRSIGSQTADLSTMSNAVCCDVRTPVAKDSYYFSAGFLDSDIQVVSCADLSLVGYHTADENRLQVVGTGIGSENAVAYYVGHSSSGGGTIGIYKVEVPPGATALVQDLSAENNAITVTKLTSLPFSTWQDWYDHLWNYKGAFWDNDSQRLYIIIQGGRLLIEDTSYRMIRYDPATNTVERTYTLNHVQAADIPYVRVANGKVAWISGTTMEQVDLNTGVVSVTTGWDFASGGSQLYDGLTNRIYAAGDRILQSEKYVVIDVGRATGGPCSLASIVTDLCERAGLQDADIDVTELTDNVPGYILNQQMTIRSAIEPLSMAYKFDGVESDYLLKWLKRGRAPSLTISQSDLQLLSTDTGQVVKETRTQEIELPERVSVVYLDPDNDYQQNTQTAKRVSNPTPTMYSRNQVSNTFPISLSADDAKNLAASLLYTTWIERVQPEFNTGWKYLKLDPVDSVNVLLDDGTQYTVRLLSEDVGADLSMQFKACNEDATSYSTVLTADGGQGVPVQTVKFAGATKTFIWDSPLLRDADDTGGATTLLYSAGGGYGLPNWPGEVVMMSADGASYETVTQNLTEVAWGACMTTLPATDTPFQTDNATVLQVRMSVGEDQLESVTQLEMYNGANAAAIINETSGIVEIIQYRDVTLNGDGTYSLTGLLRGRRGTDTFCGSHTSGEYIVLLSTSMVTKFPLAIGAVGSDRYFKGVPFGTFLVDASTHTIKSDGRPLRPYAPVHTACALSGSDIAITWDRRTRMGGDLRDGVGTVPLNEETESYEIDIYDAGGTTVLRTLTATSETVTYLSANITTDFGTTPDTLTLAVYQISAAVGRGFGYKVTVDVS